MDKTDQYVSMIEKEIAASVPMLTGELASVPEMLRYSLESGGKRVRPLLCLLFCDAAGGDVNRALPYAAAVEFVHTYSLIHDDLPCMDNDDYRRGKLSSHKRFGEANALLAGDALLTHAFSLIAQAALDGRVTADSAVKAAAELSRLCGASGMIGGQYIDLAYENKEASADVLFQQDALKTAALIEAACVLGLIAAQAGETQIQAARDFARGLGLAFQITDDILEVTEGGVSSDEVNGKATYVSLMGMEQARECAESYTESAVKALGTFGDKAAELRQLADALLHRTK